MSFVNADILRQRYFELSKLCVAEIAKGARKEQLETIRKEMDTIIRALNEIDGRDPSDLILE